MDCGKENMSQNSDESKRTEDSEDSPTSNDCMDLSVKNKNETNESKNNQSSDQASDKEKSADAKSDEEKENSYNNDTAMELVLERIISLEDQLKMHAFDDDESDSDLENDDFLDDEDVLEFEKIDAKTLGFLACAQETMKYLTSHGVSRDNPMMVNLRNKLIEEINRI